MKLFPILLIIWEYDLRRSAAAAGWAVLLNNIVAVEILSGCGWVRAGGAVGIGAVVRGIVEGGLLGWAGVREDGVWGLGW